jgi:hypothetical protein
MSILARTKLVGSYHVQWLHEFSKLFLRYLPCAYLSDVVQVFDQFKLILVFENHFSSDSSKGILHHNRSNITTAVLSKLLEPPK